MRKAAGGKLSDEQLALAKRVAVFAALAEDCATRLLAGERLYSAAAWLSAERRRAEAALARSIKARPKRVRLPHWMARLPELEVDGEEEAEQTTT
jgi:hypothetical protein